MRLHEIESYNIFADPIYAKYKAQIKFSVDKYIQTNAAIYKGSPRYKTQQIIFRDPMSFPEPRTSANTMNYYTLWIDNSPKWSNFPKRSRSMVCTSSIETAQGYGGVGVVVPLVDTAIGVCTKDDLWYSFDNTMPSGTTLLELVMFINELLRDNDLRVNSKTVSFAELQQNFAKIKLTDEYINYNATRMNKGFYDIASKTGGLGQMMDYILDPDANGFTLTSWKQYNVTGNHEVWLSAPCIIIPIATWNTLINS